MAKLTSFRGRVSTCDGLKYVGIDGLADGPARVWVASESDFTTVCGIFDSTTSNTHTIPIRRQFVNPETGLIYIEIDPANVKPLGEPS